MRLLTILTYYYPHWTGLTTHAVRVAEGLASRGVRVTVLTVRHSPELARDEVINGVRVVRLLPLSRFSRGMITPALPYAAARLIAQNDIVQIHTPLPEGPLVGLLCRMLRRPMVMTHHGDLVMPPGFFNQALQTIGYYVLWATGSLAGAVTSYSRDYAEHSRLLMHFRHKLVAIYPPVEVPTPNLTEARAWRDALGLGDKTVLGLAGRWVEEKGFDVLLKALPLIRERIPNAHIVYAGEPNVVYDDFYRTCLPLIEPIREHVTMLGLIRDPQRMANFYAMCDLFVQPSRTDMMGLVQIESMLCGTPVVVSDIPGARVVVQETGYGKLAPPNDPEGLAKVVVEVLQERSKYLPNREGVRRRFNTDRSIDQYQSLLEELAGVRATQLSEVGLQKVTGESQRQG